MAVTFSPSTSNDVYLIGGQSSLTGVSGGIVGPMPRFNISRSDSFTESGHYLASQYEIEISGFADLGEPDQTAEAAHGLAVAMKANIAKFIGVDNVNNRGLLEISPYGGFSGTLKFTDARLISATSQADDDATSGTQFVEYSFKFVANKSDDGSVSVYNLESASESWSYEEGGESSYVWPDGLGNYNDLHKTYTLTRTVRAKGIQKWNGNAIDETEGTAWAQAYKWCKSRIDAVDNPAYVYSDDAFGGTEFSAAFSPVYMNKNGEATIVDLGNDSYYAVNPSRTTSSNLGEGTYSVTDSWLMVPADSTALMTIEINIETTPEQDQAEITARGTITGTNTNEIDSHQHSKYATAKAELAKITTKTGTGLLTSPLGQAINYHWTSSERLNNNLANDLLPDPVSYSEEHDVAGGSINFNVTFREKKNNLITDDIISQSITYEYNNDPSLRYPTVYVSPIAVIRYGPFIWNSFTIKEKTARTMMELIYKRSTRSSTTMPEDGYKNVPMPPDINAIWYAAFISSHTESWSPKNGRYSIEVEWVYS